MDDRQEKVVHDIWIVRADAQALIDVFSKDTKVDMVYLDPPWSYRNDGGQGGVGEQYKQLTMFDIQYHMEQAYNMANDNSYLVMWCTFPMLADWMYQWESREVPDPDGMYHPEPSWEYITGGAWGKVNGLGVGHHFRGDAELILLYRKGSPKPLTTQSNMILTDDGMNNLVLARRVGHSEKPQEALRPLVEMCCPVGGLVLDLYAGESASMARACRATNRRYLGSEIDQTRWEQAQRRLDMEEQVSMKW